jgi:type II secretory pathway pseudopilin PulG
MTFTSQPKCATSGFTLIEVVCAATLLVLFVSAIFTVNQKVLASLKAQKETLTATQTFQERIEQLRCSAFSGSNIFDINWLKDNIYNASTQSIGTLASSPVETITLSIYPPDGSTSSQLTRTNGTVNIDSTNASMLSATLVRVDLQLTWTSSNGRSRLRRTSTVFGTGYIP